MLGLAHRAPRCLLAARDMVERPAHERRRGAAADQHAVACVPASSNMRGPDAASQIGDRAWRIEERAAAEPVALARVVDALAGEQRCA